MTDWIVAAHGFAVQKNKVRQKLAPTEKFKYGVTMVPPGVELAVFTPQNSIMGMDWGWRLWYQLAYDNHGGVEAANAQIHKIKKGGQIIPDYRMSGDDSFPTGVFTVKCYSDSNKVIDIRPGDAIPLSTLLKKAYTTKGVKRIYWLCCTQFNDLAAFYNI